MDRFTREPPLAVSPDRRYWIGDVEVSRTHWERAYAQTFNDQHQRTLENLSDANELLAGLDRIQALADELVQCHPDLLDRMELATHLRQEVTAAKAILKPPA